MVRSRADGASLASLGEGPGSSPRVVFLGSLPSVVVAVKIVEVDLPSVGYRFTAAFACGAVAAGGALLHLTESLG